MNSGFATEEYTFSGRAPSLAPAVDITFSKPSATFKGSKTGLRFRKLKERGQALLSRSNSTSSRKAGRPNRILSSQNDSGATALPSHDDAVESRSTAIRSNSIAANPNKGATDFRVRSMRNAAASASVANANGAAPSSNSNSPLGRRQSVDEAMNAASLSIPSRRTSKLVRNPRNIRHTRHNTNSLFTQSMDIDRAQIPDAHSQRRQSGLFRQLFACCTPVSLFKRSTSYGSVRNESPQQEHSSSSQYEHQQQSSVVDEDYARDHMEHGHLQRPGALSHSRLSATNTAVGAESQDGHSVVHSKLSTTPEYAARATGGGAVAADEAGENDWLMSRPDAEVPSAFPRPVSYAAGHDDYSSPGSGFGGVASRHSSTVAVGKGASADMYDTASQPLAAAQASDPGAYNTTYSDLDTEAGVSSLGNSAYRTAPTSVGGYTSSSAGGLRDNIASANDRNSYHVSYPVDVELGHGVPSETPANTFTKLYLDDEAYEHVPRKITLETSSADPESIADDDYETDDDNELRAEITSPPGNVATVSSERLVTHVVSQHLLPPLAFELSGRKCLVLDLDETLVHSSFREVEHPDFIVPVVLDGQEHSVYVVKRPGVDEFMRVMGQYYEIVVFTASLSMYADPVLDLLDKYNVVHHRLFRESCNLFNGNYVKDLSRLGRNIADSIIIDNSPASYAFHNNNAIGISTWLNDPMDTELRDLIPFLIDLTEVDDVAAVLSLTHNHASFGME